MKRSELPEWLEEHAAVDRRGAQRRFARLPERENSAGWEVEATVTVTGPHVGFPNDGEIVTETFPARVRTRLVYEGRPMFLAAGSAAKPEEVAS